MDQEPVIWVSLHSQQLVSSHMAYPILCTQHKHSHKKTRVAS
jgi:hypothetical protein